MIPTVLDVTEGSSWIGYVNGITVPCRLSINATLIPNVSRDGHTGSTDRTVPLATFHPDGRHGWVAPVLDLTTGG